MGLRMEAERWLREAGVEQLAGDDEWARMGRASLRAKIGSGHAWVAQDAAGAVAATFSLEGPDLAFWAAEDDLDSAVYLYKLIVARSARGSGGAVLDWISGYAHDQGRVWVRIDIWRTNDKLAAYYLAHGFRHVRTVETPHRRSGALFQRPAGPSR
jgi:hypothetical protein